MALRDFEALTFDCYGTLIDWETGMVNGLEPLTSRLPDLDRDAILEAHAKAESTQQAQTPSMKYRELLAIVYKRLAERWQIPVSHEECLTYGRSVANWPAFPDTAEALRYLKKHYKLVILSNVDNASFATSLPKLGVDFDAIYTAEDVGSYKPNDANFHYMLDTIGDIGVTKDKILHVAESLFHDHVPANRHGLANCWIHRRPAVGGFGAPMNPGEMPTTTMRFRTMAELAEAHRAEAG